MPRNRDASCVRGAHMMQESRRGLTDARCSEASTLGQMQALADVGKRTTGMVDLTFAVTNAKSRTTFIVHVYGCPWL